MTDAARLLHCKLLTMSRDGQGHSLLGLPAVNGVAAGSSFSHGELNMDSALCAPDHVQSLIEAYARALGVECRPELLNTTDENDAEPALINALLSSR